VLVQFRRAPTRDVHCDTRLSGFLPQLLRTEESRDRDVRFRMPVLLELYTRSLARPNPVGLHPVMAREIESIEVFDARRWPTSSQPPRVPTDDRRGLMPPMI
jgi:hypothetical protein